MIVLTYGTLRRSHTPPTANSAATKPVAVQYRILRVRDAGAGTTESVIMDVAPFSSRMQRVASVLYDPRGLKNVTLPEGGALCPLSHRARRRGHYLRRGEHGRQGLADRPIRGEPNPSPGRRLSHAGISERCRRR